MAEGQKHTEGQLAPHPHSKTTLVSGKRLVAACGGYQSNIPGEDDQGENEANARRVAATWNACIGIPTEELETRSSNARAETGPAKESFQDRVWPWMGACFGPTISGDTVERNHRFLEEALELVQACGCSREDCLQLVDYVYGRPVGEPSQEVGGVMVTLAALCLANELDMHDAAEVELARVWTKIDVIRAKQAAKPRGSVLPVSPSYQAASAPAQSGVRTGELVEALMPFAKAYQAWGGGNAREHFASSVVPAHFARAAEAVAKHRATGQQDDGPKREKPVARCPAPRRHYIGERVLYQGEPGIVTLHETEREKNNRPFAKCRCDCVFVDFPKKQLGLIRGWLFCCDLEPDTNSIEPETAAKPPAAKPESGAEAV